MAVNVLRCMQNYNFFHFVCMGVKLGRSHWGRNKADGV